MEARPLGVDGQLRRGADLARKALHAGSRIQVLECRGTHLISLQGSSLHCRPICSGRNVSLGALASLNRVKLGAGRMAGPPYPTLPPLMSDPTGEPPSRPSRPSTP